ncbi:MAG: PTS sugar transporter subunit IIB [Erysipelotrichaceae bacterium]|nr:PTS sugar transporter subunit IIB [Erysipelotrichaceae bacterium]
MITIRLFCSAGMSTSLLVTKMQDAARQRGIEADISAHPESQMQKNLENVDVVLLGPQARFVFEKTKKLCEPKGIPAAVIPMQDYGRMDGNRVLDFALDLMKKI